MSTNQQSNNNEEEVDLGSLFVIIGKGFSNFFNFIGNIFKGIFHVLISILIFFKENIVKIGIALVLGFILGFFIDFNKEKVYESVLVVKPNFGSSKQLFSNIQYYNQLIISKDSLTLNKKFKLNNNESMELKGFSIEPVLNSNVIVKEYDKLIKSVDTAAVNKYSFENFKESFTKYDYEVFEIKAKSTNKKIFSKLSNAIIEDVVENKYLKELKLASEKSFLRNDSFYQKNLENIDSLNKVYRKAMLEDAKNSKSQGTSINLSGNKEGKIREIELFNISKQYNTSINFNAQKQVENSNIINIISNFQNVGVKSGGIFQKSSIKFSALFFLFVILFLAIKGLNSYLSKYKK